MQKIDLLGMELVDHSLKEALWITDSFLKNGAPNTILFVSAKMLVGVNSSQMQKEWMEAVDLIVWSDAQVLQQVGITSKSRIHEVENLEYMKEVLRRLEKQKRPVYLLAETEDALEHLRRDLLHARSNLHIVGESVVSPDENVEILINEINSKTPTAVISRLHFPEQIRLMSTAKKYLYAEIWIALNEQVVLNEERPSALRKLLNRWDQFAFRKLIKSYETNEDVKSEDS